MKKIVIIDPDFEQLGGHNIAVNEIIRSHTTAPLDIVCSSALPEEIVLDGATIKRVLPFNSYEAHKRCHSLSRRARMQFQRLLWWQPDGQVDVTGFGVELLRVFQSANISAHDAVVVHTASAVVLNAIMDALGEIAESDWPDLHFRQIRPLEDMSYERQTHLRARRMKKLGKLFMYAETNAFAAQLETLDYDRSAIDLVEFSDLSRPVSRRPDPQGEFEIAMLGTVRLEKGHGQLARIARAYQDITDRLGGPRLKVLIQTGAVKNQKLYRSMLSGLEAAGVNFAIFDADSGLAGHWRCIQRCHAVIMPYDRLCYIDRGSAVGMDAIAAARPLVVAGNCTLEEYIRNHNGLSASGPRKMAEALYAIASNYSEFAGNALELAKVFRIQQIQSPLFSRLNSPGPAAHEAGRQGEG